MNKRTILFNEITKPKMSCFRVRHEYLVTISFCLFFYQVLFL